MAPHGDLQPDDGEKQSRRWIIPATLVLGTMAVAGLRPTPSGSSEAQAHSLATSAPAGPTVNRDAGRKTSASQLESTDSKVAHFDKIKLVIQKSNFFSRPFVLHVPEAAHRPLHRR